MEIVIFVTLLSIFGVLVLGFSLHFRNQHATHKFLNDIKFLLEKHK